MPFYRSEDGRHSMHVNFGRKKAVPHACRARRLETDNPGVSESCLRMASKLCDAPVGHTFSGKPLTCDTPICEKHATHVDGEDLDYCPRHRQLAAEIRA